MRNVLRRQTAAQRLRLLGFEPGVERGVLGLADQPDKQPQGRGHQRRSTCHQRALTRAETAHEVGELPLPLQPKLLRALQEREFDRLGDTRAVKVDIRVIATTNRALDAMVKEGSFRADLFYRLNVIPLSLPALRERPEDITELAEHFVRLYAPSGVVPHLGPELLRRLQQHSWPGNVRELGNLMRRAVALSGSEIGVEVLGPSELSPSPLDDPQESRAQTAEGLRPGVSLESVEKRLLEVTLDATGGNRSRAAEMLGVSLRTVRNKIREYGLPPRRSYADI